MVREFRKLGPDVQNQLRPVIDGLAKDPRPPGVKKLTNEDNLYRVRSGDYRIIYQITDKTLTVLVVRVADRKDAY